MKKSLTFLILCMMMGNLVGAQSFQKNQSHTIPGSGGEIFDTLLVSGLSSSQLNGSFGLDSVRININYAHDQDLEISLIAPDGTVAPLSNNLGSSGSNFHNTRFSMASNTLINMVGAPFNGVYRPECWLGIVNNGQNGNGYWVLHIHNSAGLNTTGTLTKWGLHFGNNPAAPSFFTESNLPIIRVNTENNQVINHITKANVNATMGIVNNPGQTNHLSDPFNDFSGNIQLKVRGSSSSSFPQYSYTVTTQNAANDDDSDVVVLGMPAGSKWVLYGAWDDKSLIRNVITYLISNAMGDYAPRTRLCELVLNGDYKGVYVFMEKIKRGSDRVDIQKMSSTTVSGKDLTGGYIFQVDRGDDPGYDSWQSNFDPCPGKPLSFVYEYPDEDAINSAQKNYLAAYVDSFEQALNGGNLYDTVAGYRHFIDVPSFIDQSLLQELGHNVDGYRLSSFFHKAKNRKLMGGPIWDFNLAYGNADYYNGSAVNNFEWNFPCSNNDGNNVPFWWAKLADQDTVYWQEYKCRYTQLRQSVLDTGNLNNMFDSLAGMLTIPQSRNFTRWPILGVYLWPNFFVGNTWQEEMNFLKGWLFNRIVWLDAQLYDAACLSGNPPTGINDGMDLDRRIIVYPNPSSGLLKVTAKGLQINNIAIYTVTGQQIYQQQLNRRSSWEMDLGQNQIAAGIYQMTITTNQGVIRKKVVVLPK